MRKIIFLPALLLMLCLSACAMAATVSDTELSSGSVGKYELLEITFETDAEFINPFDTSEVDIQAVFTAPSGKEIRYPAFYQRARRDLSQDFVPERDQFGYDYNYDTKRFTFVPEAGDCWCVRFSGDEEGTYSFRFEIILKGEKSLCDGGAFTVTESENKGVICRSVTNPQYLAYRDSGEQFIPVGMNDAQNWDTFGYTRVLKAIAENGGNFARIWSGTDFGYSSLTIENWNYGPHMYNLDLAEAFDRVTRVAKEEGVRLQVCFDSFSALNTGNQYGQFASYSIYNVKNGGYLTDAAAFWEDESCRRDYMDRVRYLMARCMWDPNIVLWELFNEINGVDRIGDKAVQKAAAAWCSDMRDYILTLDPYDRLVGASFADGDRLSSWETLARKCGLDYIQVHHYNAQDLAATMNLMESNTRKYSDMAVIGEFGSDAAYRAKDPEWIYVHIGLWSGLHTGAANVPLYWYHEELVESGYQKYLQPLKKYIDAFDFVSEKLQDARMSLKGDVKAFGLTNKSGTATALYVYNSAYTWAKPGPVPAENVSVTLKGLRRGNVQIDVWDTMKGEIIRSETAKVAFTGTLKIEFESLATDAAVIVRAVD